MTFEKGFDILLLLLLVLLLLTPLGLEQSLLILSRTRWKSEIVRSAFTWPKFGKKDCG